jgi:hypothetical protein
MSKLKRHRGGQPGNQNARKHGFFSASMSPEELCEFWKNLKTGDGAPRELVVLRTKVVAALNISPGNRRIINDASRLVAQWVISQDPHASRREKAKVRKAIRFVYSEIGKLSSETIESITPETLPNFAKRIEAGVAKCL